MFCRLVADSRSHSTGQRRRILGRKLILQFQKHPGRSLLFRREQCAVILRNIQLHSRRLDRPVALQHILLQILLQIYDMLLLLIGLRRGKAAVRHLVNPVTDSLYIIRCQKHTRVRLLVTQNPECQRIIRNCILHLFRVEKFLDLRGLRCRLAFPEQHILRFGQRRHYGNDSHDHHSHAYDQQCPLLRRKAVPPL